MLVLSRRQGDRIVFPDFDTTVQVVQISGKNVRLGIEAPRDVRVLRHELKVVEELTARFESVADRMSSKERHRLRNRLNAAQLSLFLLEKQIEAGCWDEARESMALALKEFARVQDDMAPALAKKQPAEPEHHVHALLVEDDANESELLAGILRMSGIECDTAGDGNQALDYLEHHNRPENRPDVVLLDMKMPRCDGPSMVSAIRRNPQFRDLKVFAVSGSTPQEVGLSVSHEGVDRWFSKPIDPDRLLKAMRQELAGGHVSA